MPNITSPATGDNSESAAGQAPEAGSSRLNNFISLALIGLASQLIYLLYIIAFPLISNIHPDKPAGDLEILMRGYPWFAPIYTTGLLLLYYLFWRAIQVVTHLQVEVARLKMFILAFGLLFGFTLIWLYPITAIDLFGYVIRGRIWAVYGQSPMLVPPNHFPHDPYLALAGEFDDLVSVYGPLWEILVQIPLRLGAIELIPGVIGIKLLMLLFYGLCAFLIGWVARLPSGPAGADNSLVALTFFAWNPLILMQGLGNGHNDLAFMTLIVLGIILWQRRLWWATTLALTLAVTAKFTALLMLPLFVIVLLRPAPDNPPTWQRRLIRGLIAFLISLLTAYLLYRLLGPVDQVFSGILDELTVRRGFALASGLRYLMREIIPRSVAETLPRTTARYIFIIFYAWLLLKLWRNRLNLVGAGFLAYLSQILLGATFRIWYPTWLIPLAALQLTPATLWPTLLFGLTAELSIVNYFVVWRWSLRDLAWGKTGPLAKYWNYWTVMHLLTVPWVFGIPLLGPIIFKWRQRQKTQVN